jgi:hypothetical protein
LLKGKKKEETFTSVSKEKAIQIRIKRRIKRAFKFGAKGGALPAGRESGAR